MKCNSQSAQIWENKKINICAIFLLTNWWGMWYNEKPVRANVDRPSKSQMKMKKGKSVWIFLLLGEHLVFLGTIPTMNIF